MYKIRNGQNMNVQKYIFFFLVKQNMQKIMFHVKNNQTVKYGSKKNVFFFIKQNMQKITCHVNNGQIVKYEL